MDKIYEQAKDLHVVATRVYTKDGCAYIDAEYTKQYTTSELKEVFIKGALIDVDGALYKAVGFDNNSIKYFSFGGVVENLTAANDEESTTELQTGTYKAMMDDGYSYATITLNNEDGNQTLEYIDYAYDVTTETCTQSETLTGTWYAEDGILYIGLDSDNGHFESCETIENGFIYAGVTFTYQEQAESKGYVGSWTYTQVGEGDTGLSDGDIFNMTINEDKTISMTLYNAVGGQTDNVDLSQADITELENGLKLSFEENQVHILTLVDENTLHVSLYDDSIKFDATRVA